MPEALVAIRRTCRLPRTARRGRKTPSSSRIGVVLRQPLRSALRALQSVCSTLSFSLFGKPRPAKSRTQPHQGLFHLVSRGAVFLSCSQPHAEKAVHLHRPQRGPVPNQFCLTLRSSGAPTACHAGHQALGLRPILRLLPSAPYRCRPLNSNYKGFPLCQANECLRAAQRLDSLLDFTAAASPRSCALRRSIERRCGRTNYKRSSMQLHVLRTLMKDARGGLIR